MRLKIGLLKELSRRISQRREKRKCYTSVEDLPILLWFKIHETQDFTLLFKGTKTRFVNVHKVWTQIYDEYIKVIGLNDEFIAFLEKLRHIGMLANECVIDPSPINKLNYEAEKLELQEKETIKGVPYNEIIAQVSKSQGYSVRNVSVVEFYSYLKINNGK